MLRLPTRQLLSSTSRIFTPTFTRPLSSTPRSLFPRKDTQDKDSVSPRRSEGSLTGGDDAVAENSDAAFNPDKTRPEQEKKTAGEGNEPNPLDVSAGNPEVSKPKPEEGGSSKGTSTKSSGAGGAPKAGGNKSG